MRSDDLIAGWSDSLTIFVAETVIGQTSRSLRIVALEATSTLITPQKNRAIWDAAFTHLSRESQENRVADDFIA
jgi:hypothetical protein